jgi:putative PIN family toxin of toxin-antitoxin system
VRVFVDTNVWLAGRFGRGLCADLLEALIDEEIEILLDERVLAEFRRIGRDKFAIDDSTLDEADLFFNRYATILSASPTPTVNVPDPDDAFIISAALSADASIFVTGDKALLGLESLGRMQIVDPRTIFMRLRGLS